MDSRNAFFGRSLVALSIVAALTLSGTVAEAGRGHGNGHKKHKHKARYRTERVVYVERHAPVVIAQPVRYVSYVEPRVVVVRPTPYVHVGARIGRVSIGAVFGPRATYSDYDYGCNFCDAHYNTFASYDAHVHNCGYRPQNVQIVARGWDDQGYGEWSGRDPYACRGAVRYDDGYRYDDRYEDVRYDDRYADGRRYRGDWND
jgi:hypothetical protein